MPRHKHILIPEPKIEVRLLYGLEDFYNKILSPFEQKLWELFVFYHFDIDKICEITNLSRRSISWRIRKMSNKVWFYGSKDLVDFYLANAGYRRRMKWRPYPKVFTPKQKIMHKNKLRGIRKFVNVDSVLKYQNPSQQQSTEQSTK